jgi:hypothetical protein
MSQGRGKVQNPRNQDLELYIKADGKNMAERAKGGAICMASSPQSTPSREK